MSYNVRYATAPDGENHWNKRKDFLAETILNFDPDLLGTQETLATQLEYLATKLTGFESVSAGRDDGKKSGEMAALFFRTARFEKLAEGHFWLSTTTNKTGSKGWDAALPRIASWVKLKDKLEPDGLPVLFLNTHLDHRGRQARLESVRLIRQKIEELGKGCQIIVTGDFNAGTDSQPYATFFNNDTDGKPSPFLDTYRHLHPPSDQEGTFCGFNPTQTKGPRIDWIACSRDWDVRNATIDLTSRENRTPSDHFAVTAVLRRSSPEQNRLLRVLSYNIHHGEGTDGKLDLLRLARLIRSQDPDLVALQEVDHKTTRSKKVDQAAELANLTGLHVNFGKAINYGGGEYGQAILSRFPLKQVAVHLLPNEARHEQRIALEARFQFASKEYSFITTHLDHQNSRLREKQVSRLNELLTAEECPRILAGDLNDAVDSQALTILKQKWKIAEDRLPLLTFPAAKPTGQIDYIAFHPNDQFKTRSAWVIPEPIISDHCPVVAILEVRP